MRIAAFDGGRLGVVGNDETVVDVTDLLQQYDPLGPEDLLPDLITHFADLRPELQRRVAAGGGRPLGEVRLRSPPGRSQGTPFLANLASPPWPSRCPDPLAPDATLSASFLVGKSLSQGAASM